MSKPKSTQAKRYPVQLLGEQYVIGYKAFNRLEFLEPAVRYSVPTREKHQHMARFPLSPAEIGQVSTESAFEDLSKVFDNSKLRFELPGSTETLTAAELHVRALSELPDPEGSQYRSYDMYAKRHFKVSYATLLDSHKTALVQRFKKAFEGNLAVGSRDSLFPAPDPLSFSPVLAPAETVDEYKNLAAQGHIYSQYLVGLLLATSTGGFSASCIEYLLEAHEHKQPESLRVLAEFLHHKGDKLGATQCALLSLAGGHNHASSTLDQVVAGATHEERLALGLELEKSGFAKFASTAGLSLT